MKGLSCIYSILSHWTSGSCKSFFLRKHLFPFVLGFWLDGSFLLKYVQPWNNELLSCPDFLIVWSKFRQPLSTVLCQEYWHVVNTVKPSLGWLCCVFRQVMAKSKYRSCERSRSLKSVSLVFLRKSVFPCNLCGLHVNWLPHIVVWCMTDETNMDLLEMTTEILLEKAKKSSMPVNHNVIFCEICQLHLPKIGGFAHIH